MSELLGDELQLLAMLPDYDDIVWKDLKSPTPWSDLDGLRCDIAFAKKGLRDELARLSEIERTTDKVTADWSERCQKLESERDRLLTLATRRGARMQIMREWMGECSICETCGDLSSTTDWYKFMQDRPEAGEWFDKDGVPVDA